MHFAWRNPCDVDFSIRLTEVTESDSSPSVSETESDSQSHSLTVTVTGGDGHSTRCHRPPPDAIHATMYFMLLHRSVNSR